MLQNINQHRISPERSKNIDHVALTSMSQGMIPVAADVSGKMKAIDAWYAIELLPTQQKAALITGESGTVRIQTKPKSLIVDWIRKIYRTLLRESGF